MIYNNNNLNSLNINDGFKAFLKDENDNLLEIGNGVVSPTKQSVDFFSDFVPLLKFKSTAKIIKLIDDEECHCFMGEVYLSSKTRLQLLNIKDHLITYKELHQLQKVNISGKVISDLTQCEHNNSSIDIDIFSISLDEVCFTASKEHQIDDHLILETNVPIKTSGITLNVYKQLHFSDQKTVCYATIESCPEVCKKTIIDFLYPLQIIFG